MTLTLNNVLRVLFADTEFGGELIRSLSGVSGGTDSKHLFLGHRAVPVKSLQGAVFTDCVLHVLLVGAQEQVFEGAAGRDASTSRAIVADFKAVSNWPIGNEPHGPMGADIRAFLATTPDCAVAIAIDRARPKAATICVSRRNARIQAIRKRLRKAFLDHPRWRHEVPGMAGIDGIKPAAWLANGPESLCDRVGDALTTAGISDVADAHRRAVRAIRPKQGLRLCADRHQPTGFRSGNRGVVTDTEFGQTTRGTVLCAIPSPAAARQNGNVVPKPQGRIEAQTLSGKLGVGMNLDVDLIGTNGYSFHASMFLSGSAKCIPVEPLSYSPQTAGFCN